MSTELALVNWDQGTFEFQRKLGNFVQYFQINLPNNGYGIPMKLINPVDIASDIMDCATTDDVPDEIVDRAIMNIDFEEGLPIIAGTPIWERFDGEHVDYYRLFKEYREALYVTGTRAIAKLAQQFNILGSHLSALSKIYHWQIRCKAYDLFKRVEAERKRLFAIEKLESRHAKASETMLEQALTWLTDHPEQMSHKSAIAMIQLAMKAGRLALGLNAEKPGSGDSVPNININQTASASSGEAFTSGTVGQGTNESHVPTPDEISYLQSIMHILDKSGALDKAARVVEADYTVMESDAVV
jgi:hypothetical protein